MPQKTLLSIVDLGGYSDLTPIYQACGFVVTSATNMRKALTHIKHNHFDIIIAEFIFSPTYGTQLSNFEGLIAGIQRHLPEAKLVAFYDKKDEAHLNKVSERFALLDCFSYPIDEQKLKQALSEL